MDWIKLLDEHSGLVVAISTVAYLGVTLLLWVETRASRIDANDAARVVVRYGTSRSGRITDVAELLNSGPALATDIRVTLAFIGTTGHAPEERSLVFPVSRNRRLDHDHAGLDASQSQEAHGPHGTGAGRYRAAPPGLVVVARQPAPVSDHRLSGPPLR